MRVVGVTGGGGFIGGWVCRSLKEHGYEVIVMDRMRHGSDPQVFLGDVRDATAVTEFAAHVDGIIHLAAVLGTQETIGNPRPAAETNILGGLNVLEAASQYGLPLVYAGVGNHFMRNDAANAYTITKTCIEDFLRMFNAFRGAKFSVVRPVNAYGPGQSIAAPFGPSKVRKIMPSFICRALLGEDIELYGGGSQISDCVYVADVAEAFVRTLIETESHPLERPVEIGPLNSFTVRQTAEMVIRAVVELTGGAESRLVDLPMRPGETPGAMVYADVATLAQIGMQPSKLVPLYEGIQRTVAYYRETWLPYYHRGGQRG